MKTGRMQSGSSPSGHTKPAGNQAGIGRGAEAQAAAAPETARGGESVQSRPLDILEQEALRLYGRRDSAAPEVKTDALTQILLDSIKPAERSRPLDVLEQEVQRLYGKEKTAPGTGTAIYTDEEAASIRREGRTFRNIIAGIDMSVSEFFNKWKNGRSVQNGDKLEKLYLGKISFDTWQKVETILGYDIDSRDFIVTNDGVKHILDRHGDEKAEGAKGNMPLTQDIIDALPEIVAKPDSIEPGARENRDPHRKGVVFKKIFPNGTAVYVQFDNSGRGTFEGRTLYVKKRENPTSALSAPQEAGSFTSETTEPGLSQNGGTRPPVSDITQRSVGVKPQGTDALTQILLDSIKPAERSRPLDVMEREVQRLYGRRGAAVDGGGLQETGGLPAAADIRELYAAAFQNRLAQPGIAQGWPAELEVPALYQEYLRRICGVQPTVPLLPEWSGAEPEPLVENPAESDIIGKDILIHKSLGAQAKNYQVFDPSSGKYYSLVEGTRIKHPKVFAGKGGVKPLRPEVAEGLSEQIGGKPAEWQHCKGIGLLDCDGKTCAAEIHWFQEPSVGKHRFRVKIWFDD